MVPRLALKGQAKNRGAHLIRDPGVSLKNVGKTNRKVKMKVTMSDKSTNAMQSEPVSFY